MNDNENKITPDEDVVQRLTNVAEDMGRILVKVVGKHDNHEKDLEYLREDLVVVRDAIHHIAKVLHEGNGDKPLITRVALLEEKVSNLEKDEEAQVEINKINKKGRYTLYTALATGVTGLVTALISLLG